MTAVRPTLDDTDYNIAIDMVQELSQMVDLDPSVFDKYRPGQKEHSANDLLADMLRPISVYRTKLTKVVRFKCPACTIAKASNPYTEYIAFDILEGWILKNEHPPKFCKPCYNAIKDWTNRLVKYSRFKREDVPLHLRVFVDKNVVRKKKGFQKTYQGTKQVSNGLEDLPKVPSPTRTVHAPKPESSGELLGT